MTTEQLSFWLQLLSAFGVGGVIAAIVVAYFLKSYIPAYLSKKAENLATKEDIAEITDKIERVRNNYAVLLEELKARHQLRLAALEQRLKAHQEAFRLWRSLNRAAHDGQDGVLPQAIQECQTWWDSNCLYLTAECREAFANAFWAAQYLRPEMRSGPSPENLQCRWKQLSAAGEKIVAAVELPPLQEEARDVLRNYGDNGG